MFYNIDLQKRIHNLVINSDYSKAQAKALILKNYENQIEYFL